MTSHHSQFESESCLPTAERMFCEFRRKVRDSELLSAAIVNLLRLLKYTGKLCIVVQNGEILKCGYEEGYFRRTTDLSF